jgi:hypothetical protein
MKKVVTKKRIKKTDFVTYVIGQKRETREVDSSFDKTIERYKACLTQNEDIVARRWIMIDVDAGQPTNTNSSDKEKADAREMLQAVDEYLQKLGIKAVLTDSGNGYHAYVRVDLPNDDESTKLVSSVLRSLAKRFDGKFGTAHIDIAVSNAGRITKATGTVAFKGSNTRPSDRRRHPAFSGWAGNRALNPISQHGTPAARSPRPPLSNLDLNVIREVQVTQDLQKLLLKALSSVAIDLNRDLQFHDQFVPGLQFRN